MIFHDDDDDVSIRIRGAGLFADNCRATAGYPR